MSPRTLKDDEPGEKIVQDHNPNDPISEASSSHDFAEDYANGPHNHNVASPRLTACF